MKSFDLIIVGAGVAGSSLARLTSEKNWSVLLIEKDECVGQSAACGGLFSKKYFDMFVEDPATLEQPIQRIDFVFPWGISSSHDLLVTVQRDALDRHLAKVAEKSGALLLTANRVVDVAVVKSGEVMVKTKNRTSGDIREFQSHLCVFADGPRSLARNIAAFSSGADQRQWSFALSWELDGRLEEQDVCKIYLDKNLVSWGYGWVFPNRGKLNVGMGTILPQLKKVHLKSALDYFINRYPQTSPYLKKRPVLKRTGGYLPMSPLKRFYDDSLAVIGDAAGMTSPLFGAGIDNAFEAALLLAEIVDEALRTKNYSREVLIQYQSALERGIIGELRKQSLIAKIIIASMHIHASLPTKLLSVIGFGRHYNRRDKVKTLFYPALGRPRMKS